MYFRWPVEEIKMYINDNYAQLFLDHFSYQKTRIFTNNKTLSSRLDGEAKALRDHLQELAKNNQHTLADVIQIVTDAIYNVRAERDKQVQSTKTKYVYHPTSNTTEPCARCNDTLVRKHFAVTPTFFTCKSASFERKTAYAMYRISVESAENGLLAAIQRAFKIMGFKLNLWTPKTAPKNESIDHFLKWMHSLGPIAEGHTYLNSKLDTCNSRTCRPPPVVDNKYPADNNYPAVDNSYHDTPHAAPTSLPMIVHYDHCDSHHCDSHYLVFPGF